MNVKKDEKRGTWYFVVEAGKDEKGKRKQIFKRGFKTEAEAKREMRKVATQIDENTYVKPTKRTLADFFPEWLQSKSLKLRKHTLEVYTGHVNKHIVPRLGRFELVKITTAQIEKFYIDLAKESELSPRTVLDIHKILKSAFEAAVKRKYVSSNPVKDAETPKVDKKEMSVWDVQEANQLLKVAKEHRLYPAFLLALTTGMRQSEILGLRWKDIDFENETLNVRQTLSHDGKELTVQTKTRTSTRTISLDGRVLETLQKHKRIVMKEMLAIRPIYQNNDLVICTGFGTPILPRNLLRTFYNLIKKAEVPKIRFHDLRHTVATLMLQGEINPKVVKEILGHSDVRITLDIYSHVLPSVHKETAQKYGNMLFNQANSSQ
ncbi:site-specific integrase [Paenibacillus sp. F411]|uniref:site-specific integrase n=1 Tax=Paenibacillus sp. F411 TaxID=2820239 RepID=UPI001AAE5EAE|nr:site-specific integrase [Paenibacillus sp. F411]MBO2942517.1 site-specific integrase [Paenibacillus sp. F411]